MIINIRGTNGSGKTTIIKRFLERYPYTEVHGALGSKRPEAYMVRIPGRWLFIIGPYHNPTGGVDALGLSAEQLVELLERYLRRCAANRSPSHIIFEGVVISTYFGAVGEFLVKHKDSARVVYLDTPLQVCLKAIAERTGGDAKTKNVEAKVKMIERTQQRFNEAGVETVTLSRDSAFETINDWLRK